MNYKPWAKSGQPSVFVNKILLEGSHFFHLYTVYGCFLALLSELNSCSYNGTIHKVENILYLVLYKEGLRTVILIMEASLHD